MKKLLQILTSPRFLFVYTVAALAVPNVALCFTEHMPFMACLANVVLPTAVYALLMALSAKTGRQVWRVFLLVFFAAFQIVLIYLYGRGVIAVDMFLNLVTTNPGEAMELLDNLIPAVGTVVLLYVPLLVLAALSWARRLALAEGFRRRALRWSGCAAVAGVALVALCYAGNGRQGGSDDDASEYRAEDNVYPLNVFYNLCLAVRESYRSAHYEENVAHFRFNARPTHCKDSAEVYVLVIGETARSADFQLYGYRRFTNPCLSREPGLLVFRNVRSQSNTTHKSVPMLLSAATAEDHDRLYREKGILAAFREAGFHTVFISNQERNHSYIDFLGEQGDECKFIRDAAVTAKPGADAAALTSDERLLPYVKRTLAEGRRKLLIVLHTYGSHFNYRDRYPQSVARFLPDTPTEAKAENRPQLVNAYDNTIVQTDRLLASVITMLRRQGVAAAMLYTSDHGENIFDDSRRLFLHASPRPSRFDTDVPLLVWLSPQYAAQHPQVASALRSNLGKGVQSNASVFPTMLSIAGIEAAARADSLSLTNTRYRLGTRHYLDDHNRAVPLRNYFPCGDAAGD